MLPYEAVVGMLVRVQRWGGMGGDFVPTTFPSVPPLFFGGDLGG